MHVQSCGAASAPVGEENICWAYSRVWDQVRGFFDGSYEGTLSCIENHVLDGVVSSYPVWIYTTANMMVSKRIICTVILWASVLTVFKRRSEPVVKATLTFICSPS